MSDLSYVRNNDGTYSKLVQLSGSSIPDSQRIPIKILGTSGQETKVSYWGDTDNLPTNENGLLVSSRNLVFNGSTFDRVRNNTEGTLLAPMARTSNGSSPNQINHNAKGVLITLDISASSGTGGLKVVVHYIDPITGKYTEQIVASTAVTSVGTWTYLIYPGVSGTSYGLKESFSRALPRSWRAQVIPSDASSYTYSLGYSLIL